MLKFSCNRITHVTKCSLHLKRLQQAKSSALVLSLLLTSSTGCAAFAKPKDYLNYLNPIQKKGYLNESQDRIIKKKSFKSGELPDAQPATNKEGGLFARLDSQQMKDSDYYENLLSRPEVNGLSVLLPWSELQPQEEQFNWQTVDRLLTMASQHNKTVILRVATCGIEKNGESDTPKWVFDAGAKSIPYIGPDDKTHLMPIFWDTTYLANWSNFIKEMGERYDKHPAIHSIGITGGGFGGGTLILPPKSEVANTATPPAASDSKDAPNVTAANLKETLEKQYGMNQRQLVEHWKYVADIFPAAFPTARLNFDISPTTPDRAGQNSLDEISDYLVYRYGERIFLTRQNVNDDKHGFDQYRVLLKFRPDTYCGYQLTSAITPEHLQKLAKSALDDGISFAEVPASLLTSNDQNAQKSLHHLAAHLGYQVISQKATLPAEVISGQPIAASFTFINVGSSMPLRPDRAFDKDVAASYKVQIELRDSSGKPVIISLHTPGTPTTKWTSGKPISWEEQLKMPPLKPGDYAVFMSLVDPETLRKLTILNGISQTTPTPETSVALGTIKITPGATELGSKEPATN